ncbi:hypothetical protein J1N35_018684 [Gossypium stocksii]|uniref:Uncharacterized protein n=1 Tax=Gossypium stocksii TaxID=47602 RepID=A0A9D3VQJ1_9ROSI|nr:hypothetical protein J1N35_018684 [Gossypium stocksii]
MSENERSVFTNRRVSCLCVFPSIQVPKGSSGENQLRYLSKERWFTLINQDTQGKCSKAFKFPPSHLNVCEYIADLVNCHSLINVDAFVLNDGKESFSNENYCVDKCVGEFLIFCENSACSCKFVRMRLETYDCLNVYMFTSSLFNMSGPLGTKKLLLHVVSSDQTRVFKRGVYHYGSTLREMKPYKFCEDKCEPNVYLIDTWHLAKKTKLVYSDYNIKLIPMLSMLLIIEIHFEKIRPIYTLEFGNGLLALIGNENLERILVFANHNGPQSF